MKGEPEPTLISPVAIGATLLTSLLGLDFLSMPREAAHFCGSNGHWAVAVASGLAALMAAFVLQFQKRFPGTSILQASRMALGRPLAFVGNLVFLSVFFVWLVLAVRDATDLVLITLLNRTPPWAASGFFVIAVLYLVLNGLVSVTRLACFVVIPGAAFQLAMELIAFQGVSVTHLLPLMAVSPERLALGALTILNGYLPIAATLLVHPLLSRKEKLGRTLFVPILLAAVIFFMAVTGTIGKFGADFTLNFNRPHLASIGAVSIPYLVIEQLGVVFLILWIVFFFVGAGFYTHVVVKGMQTFFPGLRYRWAAAAALLAVWVIGLFFPNTVMVQSTFQLFRRWSALPVFAYPLFVFVVCWIRGVREGWR